MVYILLGTGFEEIEAISIGDILSRGGVRSAYVGVRGKAVTGRSNICVNADMELRDVNLSPGDCVAIPGGMGGVECIEQSAKAGELIKKAADMGLLLAAICAGPRVLAKLSLLGGRNITCYPGLEQQMTGAASVDCEKPFVIDEGLITGRAPGSSIDFSLALLAALAGQAKADEVMEDLVYDR